LSSYQDTRGLTRWHTISLGPTPPSALQNPRSCCLFRFRDLSRFHVVNDSYLLVAVCTGFLPGHLLRKIQPLGVLVVVHEEELAGCGADAGEFVEAKDRRSVCGRRY
jgi:hypothetical protein